LTFQTNVACLRQRGGKKSGRVVRRGIRDGPKDCRRVKRTKEFLKNASLWEPGNRKNGKDSWKSLLFLISGPLRVTGALPHNGREKREDVTRGKWGIP